MDWSAHRGRKEHVFAWTTQAIGAGSYARAFLYGRRRILGVTACLAWRCFHLSQKCRFSANVIILLQQTGL